MKEQTFRIPRYRVELVKDAEVETTNVRGPEDVFIFLREVSCSDRKQLVCLHLDANNMVIGSQTVSIGTADTCLVHPREVFKAAILNTAHGIILIQNRPYGNARPTKEDLESTIRIRQCGEYLGIRLIDHLIVTPRVQYLSCMGRGRSHACLGRERNRTAFGIRR